MADFGNANRRDSTADTTNRPADRRPGQSVPNAESDRVAALRSELEEKDARISKLEAELSDARNFDDLAEDLVEAVLEHLGAHSSAHVVDQHGQNTTRGRETERDRSQEAPREDTSQVDETGDAFAAFGTMTDEDAADEDDSTSTSDTVEGLAGIGEDTPDSSTEGHDSAIATGHSNSTASSDGHGLTTRSFSTEVAEFVDGVDRVGGATDESRHSRDGRPAVVTDIEDVLMELDETGRAMLARYRRIGPEQPDAVYEAVTGELNRLAAYERNRTLRRAGLVEHVGRGHYEYSLRARIAREVSGDRTKSGGVYARDIEQQFLD